MLEIACCCGRVSCASLCAENHGENRLSICVSSWIGSTQSCVAKNLSALLTSLTGTATLLLFRCVAVDCVSFEKSLASEIMRGAVRNKSNSIEQRGTVSFLREQRQRFLFDETGRFSFCARMGWFSF